MRILYLTQLSMYDKKTKELLPQADGNINMMRNTINEWKNIRPNDKFYVLMPQEVFIKNPSLNIDCQYFAYSQNVISARLNRYNFPMNEFISILKNYHFDLIITDIIELVPNLKQMFQVEFNYSPRIIANIRHVDESDYSIYSLEVYNGIMKSDYATILSDSMKPKLRKQLINSGLTDSKVKDAINKLITFEPSISYSNLIEQYKPKKDNNKVIITFPGRLSKGEEKRTNWDKFLIAINELRKDREDFKVYFTDPNNALDFNESKDWIFTIERDRQELINLYNKTNIIVSLMNVEGFGGISIREALAFNCYPVIPDVDEYKKMVPKNHKGLVHNNLSIKDLKNALSYSIDYIKENKEFNSSMFGFKFSIESQINYLFNNLIDGGLFNETK